MTTEMLKLQIETRIAIIKGIVRTAVQGLFLLGLGYGLYLCLKAVML